MRRLRQLACVVLLTAFSLLIAPRSACACSCALGTEADYERWADLVFVGVVVDIDRPLLGGGDVSVTFAVENVSKGSAADRLVLTTASDSAACGFDFGAGNRYRVYAHEGGTGLCSGNKALGAAPEVPVDKGFAYVWIAVAGSLIIIAAVVLLLLPRRRPSSNDDARTT